MLRRRATSTAAFGLAGLLVVGLAAGLAGGGSASDAILARNFGSALAGRDTAWNSLPTNVWLSSLGDKGAPSSLAPGDTITISGKDGRPDVIEVTELAPIHGDRLGLQGVNFQLVTGRSRTVSPGQVVRFLFASEIQAQPPKAAVDRVL